MKHRICLSLILLLSFGRFISAEDVVFQSPQRPVEIIDNPTADVLDHYGYHSSFRFGRDGGIQIKTLFGVFPRLNLGFGLDWERILGTRDSRLNRPTINVKFRIFDGKGQLPAIALGFDGQGYVFNKTLDEYEQREKGFYFVGTRDIFVEDLILTVGGNIFDFDDDSPVRSFAALTYTYEKILGLMFEYDNVTDYRDRRISFGAKYFVTPLFTVDLIGRNVAERPNGRARTTERVVRLSYTGSF